MKRVIVITGCASGIGLATKKLFEAQGDVVYGIDKQPSDDERVFECDICDHLKVKEVVEGIVSKEGRIDCLINNAGFGLGGEFLDSDIDKMKNMFSTNLSAYAANMIMCGNIMKKQGFGRIVNVCSLAAIFPLPYQSCYSASKAAIDVLSRTVRTELKPHGIFVSEVLPGDVSTSFPDNRIKSLSENQKVNKSVSRMEGYERKGMNPSVVAKRILKIVSSKRPRARVCVGSLKSLIFFQKILPTRMLDWLIAKIYC